MIFHAYKKPLAGKVTPFSMFDAMQRLLKADPQEPVVRHDKPPIIIGRHGEGERRQIPVHAVGLGWQ